MAARKIQVFLYGSSMSRDILAHADIPKRAFAPASIAGYQLTINPIANLVEDGDSIVYGILANFTHAEIDILFKCHLQALTDEHYFYEPVIVHTRGGRTVAAVTFMSSTLPEGKADSAYIDSLQKAIKSYGFPSWYAAHIETFRP